MLDQAKHASMSGHWKSLLTSWLGFQIWWLVSGCFMLWQVLWSKKKKKRVGGNGIFTARPLR